ncbi:MAG: beta-ketoacyl-ACP synthase II [Clostridia bacterium]|nr:beta-ketoacyl-ACP synthase II [Clostridia bacterium]
MRRRVVITGIGAVTSMGLGKNQLWDSLSKGKSGVNLIDRFDVSEFTTKIAAEVKDFQPEDFMKKKHARRMDRFTQFAVAAANMAVRDAELDIEKVDKDRFGVVLGTGIGGMETLEQQARVLHEKGPKRISPFFVPAMIGNMAAGLISIIYNARGVNNTCITACASSTSAISDAYKYVQRGDADIMITGGTEATVTPLALAGFCNMRALSTNNENPQQASRPFDAKRDGFVMGEGSGIIVIEELNHALKRNAEIYAEIVGSGMTADAYHITAPAPKGRGGAMAMKRALEDANINYSQVDYINAHGTSTVYNDKYETDAIKSIFKEHAYEVCISSTKSMTGHLLGAAGAIEAIVCALSIYNNFIPPTINYSNVDQDCDLDYVPNKGRTKKIDYALSNSFGFGGQNACLLFKRIEQ